MGRGSRKSREDRRDRAEPDPVWRAFHAEVRPNGNTKHRKASWSSDLGRPEALAQFPLEPFQLTRELALAINERHGKSMRAR